MPILQQNPCTRVVYIRVPAGNLHALDFRCHTDVGLHVMLHTFASQLKVMPKGMENESVNCVLL